MPYKASEIALAEARALILDRLRWPSAPLIGDNAARWLRPGAVAEMFERMLETDEQIAGARQAVSPMGLLDGLETFDQASAFVRMKADDLRDMGQADAARTVEAENFGTEDPDFAAALEQFKDTLNARVKRERPDPPPWLGSTWTTATVEAEFKRSPDDLDLMGAPELDRFLDLIELAKTDTKRRIDWLYQFDYPAAVTGSFNPDPKGTGLLPAALEAGWALGSAHSAATDALGRAAIPRQWDSTWITRRLFERIALRNPQLASTMMLRKPPVLVVDGRPPA